MVVPISPLKGGDFFFLEFREVSHFRALALLLSEARGGGEADGSYPVGRAEGSKRAKPLALNAVFGVQGWNPAITS